MKLYSEIFSQELIDIISERKGISIESKDLNLLNLSPLLRIYCYQDSLGFRIFEDEQDLLYFCSKYSNKDCEVYVSEFLGDVLDNTDVIRRIFLDGSTQICVVRDYQTFSVLELDNYISTGGLFWSFTFGDLKDECIAFKKRGIHFQNDVYYEEETYDRFKEYGRSKLLF